MKKRIALLLLFFAEFSQATPVIGGDTLLRWLQSKDERDGALAVGYIGGVREVTFQKEHCAAGDIPVPEIVRAVKMTLEGMPQYRHFPASSIVIEALKARWPCLNKDLGKKTR